MLDGSFTLRVMNKGSGLSEPMGSPKQRLECLGPHKNSPFLHVRCRERGVDLLDVAPLVHNDSTGFFISLKFHFWAIMQLSEIAHLKFFLELQFEPLQLGYIACQYDQIIHVGDCNQRLFDVQQLIRLALTKALFDEKQIGTVAPRPWQLFEPIQSLLEFVHNVVIPFLYETL